MNHIIDILIARAETQPTFPVFNFIESLEQLSTHDYSDLYLRVMQIARMLHEHCEVKSRAIILLPPSIDFVASMYACFYAGIIAVPAYPPLTEEMAKRILLIIKDADIEHVITTSEFGSTFSRLNLVNPFFKMINFATRNKYSETGTIIKAASSVKHLNPIYIDKVEDSLKNFAPIAIKDSDIAYLQYTSGSTSAPKGVIITHENIIENTAQIHKAYEVQKDNIYIGWLPVYHDMGLVSQVFSPVIADVKVIQMSPLQFVRKPLLLLKAITHYQGTATGGPDFALRMCTNRIAPEDKNALDLSSVTNIFLGSEKIQASTLRNFYHAFKTVGLKKEIFFPSYGMAETTVFISARKGDDENLAYYFDSQRLSAGIAVRANEGAPHIALVSVGHVFGDMKIAVIDSETHQILPENKVGELCVHGLSVMQGYWGNEEQTQNTFVMLPHDQGESRRYLKTGDLGFIFEGQLFIAGRIKELIIIAGKNHYPPDIELNVSHAHSELKLGKIALFSTEIAEQEAVVVVAEIANKKASLHEFQDITKAIRLAIAKHHQLDTYEVLLVPQRTIPRTSSGKIKRTECKALYEQSKLTYLFKN